MAVADGERARTHQAKIERAARKEGGDEEEKESTHINKRIEVGWRVDLSRMKARSLDGRRREKAIVRVEWCSVELGSQLTVSAVWRSRSIAGKGEQGENFCPGQELLCAA